MAKTKSKQGRRSPALDRPHPLDGGVLRAGSAPERLTVEQMLKRTAAAEAHEEEEKRRGLPPRGKL
jgi:hypothetical protein